MSRLVIDLSKEEFKLIEPHLAFLDKYLTLRSYIDGYTLSQADSTLWVAQALLKRANFVNVNRWFAFVKQSHPELQEEFIAKDDGSSRRMTRQRRRGLLKVGILLATVSLSKMLRWEKLSQDLLPNHRMSPYLIPDT